METHKPWYQLPAVQGLIVVLVSRLLAYCKLSDLIPPVMGVDLVNSGLEFLTGAGALWIAREIKNPATTITLTKPEADAANAEVAASITKEGTSNAQSIPQPQSAPPPVAVSGSAAAGTDPKP